MNVHNITPPLFPDADVPADAAAHHEALRAAFKHLGLRRLGYSFEQALASPALRIALRVCAEIHIRRTHP